MLQPILGEVAEGRPLGGLHVSAVGGHLTGEHPEQGGLAGAVLAAEAYAIARTDMPVDGIEYPSVGEILDDVSELQHGGVIAQGDGKWKMVN